MGIFDSLKRAAESAMRNAAAKPTATSEPAVGKGSNRSERFTFDSVPVDLAQLRSLPEASLDSAFKTTALTVLVLCGYEQNPDAVIEMLNFLKGPAEVSNFEKQFLKERLEGKYYKPFSFFEGATPENGYQPILPYTITVYENPYSFDNEGWAVLWVKSSGSDNLRQIKLRKKPSTGQWFMNEIQCLSDIRIPVSEDPWA